MRGLFAVAAAVALIGIGAPAKQAEAKATRAEAESRSAASVDLCGSQNNYICCFVRDGKAYCQVHNCEVGMPGCQWET